jgi:hypothetical protein
MMSGKAPSLAIVLAKQAPAPQGKAKRVTSKTMFEGDEPEEVAEGDENENPGQLAAANAFRRAIENGDTRAILKTFKLLSEACKYGEDEEEKED